MMVQTRKRKGLECYQLQEWRKVVKETGDAVLTKFRDKYKELKIESNRGRHADTYFMGKESTSRQRYQNQRTRRDSQGRDYYQERKGRSDSRGRPYFRRYYRPESRRNRSFSRDMRSVSRPRRERSESAGSRKRSESRESKKDFKSCIAC